MFSAKYVIGQVVTHLDVVLSLNVLFYWQIDTQVLVELSAYVLVGHVVTQEKLVALE